MELIKYLLLTRSFIFTTSKRGMIFVVWISELNFRKGDSPGQGHTQREKQSHDADPGPFLLFAFHSVFFIALTKFMLRLKGPLTFRNHDFSLGHRNHRKRKWSLCT